MASDIREEQEREWTELHDRVRAVLQHYGEEDVGGERRGYHLVDDNLGFHRHKIETEELKLIMPIVVKSLQELLSGYPNWEIVMAVASPDKEMRPNMTLVIRDDEIIDGLQRQYLPNELRTIQYEGSRPLGSKLGDVIYSGPGPF